MQSLKTLNKEQKNIIAEYSLMEAARRSYLDYCQYVHRGLWIPARHHELIAKKLQEVVEGKLKRVMFFMPPRHGKSMEISETFSSYFLGRFPNKRVITVSYGDSLAQRFGKLNRQKIMEFGNALFGIQLSKEKASMTDFDIEGHRGGMISVGLGGGITGQGADLLILDDLVKNKEAAESEVQRESTFNEWQYTLRTRLHPNAAVVLIMTRWHHDDIAGRLLNPEYGPVEDWEIVSLPAVAETEDDKLDRAIGEPLWPEHGFDDLWAADTKRAVGSQTWAALYQQRPSPSEGAMLKRQWWQYYNAPIPDQEFDELIQSWDCTFKDSDGSDFVVGTVWGRIKNRKYLVDLVRARMDFTVTLANIKIMCAKHPLAKVVLIEDKANGSAILSVLKHELSGFAVIGVIPKESKIARVSAVSFDAEAGNVYLPSFMPFTMDFVEECATFPTGSHDDQCFVKGTKIATIYGNKNIEDIKIGDRVITPYGTGKVINTGVTGYKEVITKFGLTGTKNHPIFTYDKGFTPLDTLTQAIYNDKLSLGGLIKWRYKKLLNLMVSNIDLWERENIISVSQVQMKEEKVLKDFMWQFGNFITNKQYLKGMRFITKMVTLLIMTLITWNVYQLGNIVQCIKSKICQSNSSILKKFRKWLKNGIKQKRAESGTETTTKRAWELLSLKNMFVSIVTKNLSLSIINQDFVPIIVTLNGDIRTSKPVLKKYVQYATKNLTQLLRKDIKKEQSLAADHVLQNGDGRKQIVYNITVEKDHVYYAHDFLVSNCDSFSQAMYRILYHSTAPKPNREWLRRLTPDLREDLMNDPAAMQQYMIDHNIPFEL